MMMTWDDADKVLLMYVHNHKSLFNVYRLYPLFLANNGQLSGSGTSTMILLSLYAEVLHFLLALLIKPFKLYLDWNQSYL